MYSVRREHHYKDDAADSRQWRCPVERSPEPLVSRPVDQQLPELNQNQLSFLLLFRFSTFPDVLSEPGWLHVGVGDVCWARRSILW